MPALYIGTESEVWHWLDSGEVFLDRADGINEPGLMDSGVVMKFYARSKDPLARVFLTFGQHDRLRGVFYFLITDQGSLEFSYPVKGEKDLTYVFRRVPGPHGEAALSRILQQQLPWVYHKLASIGKPYRVPLDAHPDPKPVEE